VRIVPRTTAPPPQRALERAWIITESLHALLTGPAPTDWPAVTALAEELRALAEDPRAGA
jgi:predicted RNA polymerase sigma factor